MVHLKLCSKGKADNLISALRLLKICPHKMFRPMPGNPDWQTYVPIEYHIYHWKYIYALTVTIRGQCPPINTFISGTTSLVHVLEYLHIQEVYWHFVLCTQYCHGNLSGDALQNIWINILIWQSTRVTSKLQFFLLYHQDILKLLHI